MSLLMEAYRQIKLEAVWADAIRVNALKADEDKNKTLILVRNSTSRVGDYGSNQFNTYEGSVQIQIFLSLNASFDLEEKLIALMNALNQGGWQINEVKPAIPDPDTKQLTATINISRTKEAL